MAGLTPDGFVSKTLNESKIETEQALEARFGNNVNLDPASVFGQFVGILAEVKADIWAELQALYWSQYPDFASGTALDLACGITNIERKVATPTQATVQLFGTIGTTIPQGSAMADNMTQAVYSLVDDVTLGNGATSFARLMVNTVAAGAYTVTINAIPYTYTASGADTVGTIIAGLQALINPLVGIVAETADVGLNVFSNDYLIDFNITKTANLTFESISGIGFALCQNPAPTQLARFDLSEIVTPLSGWQSVTNPTAGLVGSERETDEQLRLRRERARDNNLLGALENLANVTAARVVFNETTSTNADGVPRQHLWAIVEGGVPSEIVQVIADYKAAGIGTFGSSSGSIISPYDGATITYNFERPTYLTPTVVVSYTQTGGFPVDGEALIKQAIVDFGAGLKIGEKLYYSRLFTPINTVPGMRFSMTVNGGTADITAGTKQRIQLLAANITLTEV